MEIWKETKAPYEGYLISNEGNMKYNKGKGWEIKSVRADKDGYLITNVVNREKNIETTARIHRLVAVAFIPNPNNHPVVHHKNNIKDDNRVDNLEWCTISHNTKMAYADGAIESPGIKRIKATIGGELFSYYSTVNQCAKAFGINRNSLTPLINNSTEGYLGFVFIEEVEKVQNPLNRNLFNKEVKTRNVNPYKEITSDGKVIYHWNIKSFAESKGITFSQAQYKLNIQGKFEDGSLEKVTKEEYFRNTNLLNL